MNNNGKRLGGQIDERAWHSRYEKMEILKKTKGRCAACGKKLKVEELDKEHPKYPDKEVMTLDHIIPLSRGGWDIPSNQLPLCYACNQEKGNMLYIPSWFYTAMINNPMLDKITDNFSKWFQEHIKDNFRIEQYPLIAPKHNLLLDIATSYSTRRKKDKMPYMADAVVTWSYMGRTNKDEVLAVTQISLKEIKSLLYAVLDKSVCGPREKRRTLAVYTCRKKTTDKILTAAGIMYDEPAQAAAIYVPWMDTSNYYKACLVWSLVTALYGALDCGGYRLTDITLIMPEKQKPVLTEINNHMVIQLANIKRKTLHGYSANIGIGGPERYELLRITEKATTGDWLIDDFRDTYRKQLKQKKA